MYGCNMRERVREKKKERRRRRRRRRRRERDRKRIHTRKRYTTYQSGGQYECNLFMLSLLCRFTHSMIMCCVYCGIYPLPSHSLFCGCIRLLRRRFGCRGHPYCSLFCCCCSPCDFRFAHFHCRGSRVFCSRIELPSFSLRDGCLYRK